jgi:hypothetical protein
MMLTVCPRSDLSGVGFYALVIPSGLKTQAKACDYQDYTVPRFFFDVTTR